MRGSCARCTGDGRGFMDEQDLTTSGAHELDAALRDLGRDLDDALAAGSSRCGRYLLMEEIGEGGYGQVFLAVGDPPASRRVAVKVLKRGLDTRDVLRRFRMEQVALARIDHPGVVPILDAGVTEDGRPWFAMPMLDGQAITIGADDATLAIRDRLELMARVADAVHAAHVQGIIHRDLKPGNVMVVRGGAPFGEPKIIDFGVAKAVDDADGVDATRSGDRVRLGTPAYMAPEQRRAIGPMADVRSDVYSLGVVLAELSSGVPARDTAAWLSASEERRLPSDAVERLRAANPGAASDAAGRRGLPDSVALRNALRGDVDAVCAKATAIDPSLRYQSAEALADDLRRIVAMRPVRARVPGHLYVLRRFVRRNRVAVASAMAVAASIALAVVAILAGAVHAARSADQARREAVRAEEVSALLRGVFASIDPEVAQGRDRRMLLDVLDASAARIRSTADRMDPLVAAEFVAVLAGAYVKLEEPARARTLVDAVLPNARALLGAVGAGTSDSGAVQPADEWSLRVAVARLLNVRGDASETADRLDRGVVPASSEHAEAFADWSDALDVLRDDGRLAHREAFHAAMGLWRSRACWPSGRTEVEFDAAVADRAARLPLDDLDRWAFEIRWAEMQSWQDVVSDYPEVLAQCEEALGAQHPMAVRARGRWVAYLVASALESFATKPRQGLLVLTAESFHAQLDRALALAPAAAADIERVFGAAHSNAFAVRLWWMAALGHRFGSTAAESAHQQLRRDAVVARGEDSALVRQIDAAWRGVERGITSGKWW